MSALDLEATPWRPTWSGTHLKKGWPHPSSCARTDHVRRKHDTFWLRFVITLSLETNLPGLSVVKSWHPGEADIVKQNRKIYGCWVRKPVPAGKSSLATRAS